MNCQGRLGTVEWYEKIVWLIALRQFDCARQRLLSYFIAGFPGALTPFFLETKVVKKSWGGLIPLPKERYADSR
jgi:hypothetical protein